MTAGAGAAKKTHEIVVTKPKPQGRGEFRSTTAQPAGADGSSKRIRIGD